MTGPQDANLFQMGGQLGQMPARLGQAIAALPAQAPVQESFRAWLLRHLKIATDQSAAPGLLAETGIAAAQMAVEQLDGST